MELCTLSQQLLLEVLQKYERGIPDATPQDHTLATYASKINPEEGKICWTHPAEEIHRLIRAFSPRPGAWSVVGGKKMKILRAHLVLEKGGIPGKMISKEGLIACGEGSLLLMEVQPEGKKALSWGDYFRGNPSFQGFSS